MGYHAVSLTVDGVRSAHNSAQDDVDRAAWQMLAAQIRRWAESHPDFKRLQIEVSGPHE